MDPAGAVQDPAQRSSSGQQPQQQWDRFEVVLSKPSGSQKLGMVLKHAQVFGEERLKRGAYLAGLAEGPSLAQDLGLSPKDRLILVEGLDVKTLPFDRIVGLIRKATFPLTLVWSRQRKAGVAQATLPGTAVRHQHPTNKDGSPPPLPPSTAASTSAPSSSAPPARPADSRSRPSDKAAAVVATNTTNNNPDAAVTADWERATSKGRAASRASREAEGGERGGAGRRSPRVSSSDACDASEDVAVAEQQQQTQRAPIGEPIQGRPGKGLEQQQQQHRRSSSGGSSARNATAEATAYVPPLQGDVPIAPKASPPPPTTAKNAPAGNGSSRRSPASAGRKSREAAMSSQQQQELLREINGNGKDSGKANDNGGGGGGGGGSSNSSDAPLTAQRRRDRDKVKRDQVREDAGPGGGLGVDNVGGGGCGANGSGNSNRSSSSNNNNNQPPQTTPASSKRGRSGRGRGGGRGGRRGGGRGGKGKGGMAEAARAAASATATAEATAAAVAAAAAGEAGRDDVAAPEWLNPLMKTVLPDFQGTRYARSRLKQTLAHEWARQEYRTGIALGQVDRGMTEMDFVRRRVEGGSLYALLEQESRDYLRVGPFTDADVELLGMTFAQAQASKELPPPPAVSKPDAAESGPKSAESGPKSAKSGQEKAAKTGQEKGTKAGRKQSSGKDAAAATAGAAAAEGRVATWADRLRDLQIDIPASATYDGLASDSSRGGAVDRTDGEAGGEAAQKGGSQQEDDPSAWDGNGVDAATVIRHRRQFDLRCRAYEALNTASRNDKTNGLLEKTHRLRQDHAAIIAAKRVTLEGTLQNVRQQLNGREDQLRHVHMEQRGVNPLDTTVVAGLNESEAAIMTRVAEKKVQMAMIIDEANKVVQWEQTAELARREAMHHAADMHGHGGGFAPGSAKERNELVQSMMSQKVNIMLLSTFCKLRGPWLAPSGYVRGNRSVSDGAASPAVVAAAEEKGAEPDPRTAVVSPPSLSVNTADNTAAAAAADDKQGDRPPSGGKDESGSGGVGEPKSNNSSPTSAAGGIDGAGLGPAAGAGAGVEAKPGKRQIKLRLLPPSEAGPKKENGGGDPGQDAHRQETGQQAEGGGDAGAACAGPSHTVAAEGTASQAGDNSGDGASSVAAVMARGGKEAAVASMAGARGAGSVREQDGVDAGSKGGDSPAPMDATASTGSGNESGDREQEDGPKPESRDASSPARRGSPPPAEGDMDKEGAGAGSHSPEHSPPADAGSLRLSEGGGGVGDDVSKGTNGMDVDTV